MACIGPAKENHREREREKEEWVVGEEQNENFLHTFRSVCSQQKVQSPTHSTCSGQSNTRLPPPSFHSTPWCRPLSTVATLLELLENLIKMLAFLCTN